MPKAVRAGEHLQRIDIESRDGLRAWLQTHHRQRESVWLVIWKKGDPRHVPYADIVEEALCFGWVDSLPRKLDDARSMLLLSPRKPRSAWSALNKARVQKLIAQGRMANAGLAVVEAAKTSGQWDFLEDVDALAIPADLEAALAQRGEAAAHFAAFPASTRRGILEWIKSARRPKTRAKRIEETARLAAQNVRANQFRKRGD